MTEDVRHNRPDASLQVREEARCHQAVALPSQVDTSSSLVAGASPTRRIKVKSVRIEREAPWVLDDEDDERRRFGTEPAGCPTPGACSCSGVDTVGVGMTDKHT